ncbi:MAG: SDR family NAD(P)-dependent oxidoreductase [Hyphomonadaceae bacterium]|nr:SDR family NAD(P)-dependent oxidoreductase [Hyphomonadaceae bacterium]
MAQRISKLGIKNWKPDRLPNLKGKNYLITGGNSGIGYEAAKMLGSEGANIIIACRNTKKGQTALRKLAKYVKGDLSLIKLDLADLNSVREAAKEVKKRYKSLDGLINNAGIMQTPELKTADGFEMQLGTNHLGHFLLSGLLFDLVEKAEGRIVTVSSLAHKFGKIHFDDLMLTENYDPTTAYCQSKLANLMFSLELDRRLKAKNSPVKAIACHPGYSNTALQSTGPEGAWKLLYKFTNLTMAQSARAGAIPTVLAAAGKEAQAGAYYGPRTMSESRGRVSDATVIGRALSEESAKRLWAESEKLVGFEWEKI